MGISDKGADFIKFALHDNSVESICTLGRQFMYLSSDYESRQRHTRAYGNAYADSYFQDIYGCKVIHSIDNSDYEGCTHRYDLNSLFYSMVPIKYDLVLDAGTFEHVFDVRTAFLNIINLVRPFGRIVHILPANNHTTHGFYQFSPELFYAVYSGTRGFRDTEVFLSKEGSNAVPFYRYPDPFSGHRIDINSLREPYLDYVYVTTVRGNHSEIQHLSDINQSHYVQTWTSHSSQD